MEFENLDDDENMIGKEQASKSKMKSQKYNKA